MGGSSSKQSEALILRLGKLRSAEPGVALVRQGETSPHLFYIVNGELSVCYTDAEGKTRTLGKRGKGEVVGEISFLLNTTPNTSIVVNPAYEHDVTVCEIDRKHALATIQRDPTFAAAIFEKLSMLLAERIASASASSAQSTAAMLMSAPAAEAEDADAELLPDRFGLEAEGQSFVMQAYCTVTVDDRRQPKEKSRAERRNAKHRHSAQDDAHSRNSRTSKGEAGFTNLFSGPFSEPERESHVKAPHETQGDVRFPALIAVFTSAVCLELTALSFVSHRVVSFDEIVNVEICDEASAKFTLLLACRGYTLFVSMNNASSFGRLARELEMRRLHAMDTDECDRKTVVGDLAAAHQLPTRHSELVRAFNWVPSQEGQSAGGEGPGFHSSKRVTAATKIQAAARGLLARKHVWQDNKIMSDLTLADWKLLMSNAEYFVLDKGDAIIKEGEKTCALYQLTQGTATVEVKIKGRPQAVVVAHKQAGDLFGERTLLLGGRAHASIVVSSEPASVMRLKGSKLKKLLAAGTGSKKSGELSAKLYYFLAVDQAKRLRALTSLAAGETKHKAAKVITRGLGSAPTTMSDIAASPALCVICSRSLDLRAMLAYLYSAACLASRASC